MAEFSVVMKQAKRMCKMYELTCEGCALNSEENGCLFQNDTNTEDKNLNFLADAEKIVMNWAEKHPEPVYPNWNEAWKQAFPNGAGVPCPADLDLRYKPDGGCGACSSCDVCKDRPIPADIAEKLGIKPIQEGT